MVAPQLSDKRYKAAEHYRKFGAKFQWIYAAYDEYFPVSDVITEAASKSEVMAVALNSYAVDNTKNKQARLVIISALRKNPLGHFKASKPLYRSGKSYRLTKRLNHLRTI